MKKIPLMTALMLCLFTSIAGAQITAPYVLGCSNPTPAAAGQPTNFISACKTTAFVPLNSTSVIASVSQTAPAWAHTYSYYAAGKEPQTLLVACPVGATVSTDGSKCTNAAGADASALTAASAVPTFKIAVPVVPTVSTVGLTWTAPTQNTDGSALTDLKSYNIYQGATATSLAKVGTIVSPAVSYTTPTLAPGSYYFAVTSVNSAGVESTQSAVVSTVVAPPPPKTPGVPTNVKITVTVTAG